MDTAKPSDSSPTSLLTLQEIAQRLDVTYGRLRGFADAPGVRAYVGAVDVPGVKGGTRYEPRAAQQFGRLIQAQDARLITPKTAAAWLAGLQEAASETAIVQLPQSSNAPAKASPLGDVALMSAFVDRLMQAVLELNQGQMPPPEDRLIGRAEAAELLGCRPEAVSRYVKPVRRSVWRRSDCLRYIAGLRQ